MQRTARADTPEVRGDKWIICASGPSMLRVDLAHLRRFKSWRVMAVNNTWELVPWADVLYACDLRWWDEYGHKAVSFRGEKWTMSETAARKYGLKLVRKRGETGLCTDPGYVNTGGNGGHQAVNLARHKGMERGALFGFDMHRNNGGHWHGEHKAKDGTEMLSAPDSHISCWVRMFGPIARDLKRAGVEVVNCTPGSALPYFPIKPMGEALR